MRALTFICSLLILMIATPSHVSASLPEKDFPRITRWYEGRVAAVSLRFDDNLESHLDNVIPLLNRFGIRGAFMVSPGRSSFKKREDDWLQEVPAMGHQLGNHTMHHRGAGSLSEAEYEINEAAKIIRTAAGKPDRLLLFASGGGKRWGGKRWSNADEAYRLLPGSLDMIDLYDGNHPYVNVFGDSSSDKLIGHVDAATKEGRHQAFTFHGVGTPSLRDFLRRVVKRKNLTISVNEFQKFLQMLDGRSDNIWIAPLGDILKYRTEFRSARLEGVRRNNDRISFQLIVDTNPVLYDQPLTLVLPFLDDANVRISQDGSIVDKIYEINGRIAFDLLPETSFIQVDLLSGTLPDQPD